MKITFDQKKTEVFLLKDNLEYRIQQRIEEEHLLKMRAAYVFLVMIGAILLFVIILISLQSFRLIELSVYVMGPLVIASFGSVAYVVRRIMNHFFPDNKTNDSNSRKEELVSEIYNSPKSA